jgi:hypothetical protein
VLEYKANPESWQHGYGNDLIIAIIAVRVPYFADNAGACPLAMIEISVRLNNPHDYKQ